MREGVNNRRVKSRVCNNETCLILDNAVVDLIDIYLFNLVPEPITKQS